MNKIVGDQGEALVAALLRARGYTVVEIGGNYPVIDLEVTASKSFRVSVKTSVSKRHVRMGQEASVRKLLDCDFVFALLPPDDRSQIDLIGGAYELLIIPGAIARDDALWVHQTYLEGVSRSGERRSGSAGIMVKSYSSRPPQREAWGRWQTFRDNWSALPTP